MTFPRRSKVLFLCTENSARSQMAEGYLRHVAGSRFEAMSAGLAPAAGVDPLAVEAMAEIGINIAHQKTKDVTRLAGRRIHYLVTVCDKARIGCPVFRGILRFLHWNFDDPCAVDGSHEQKLAVFRRVRDEIATRIHEELLAPLAARTIAGKARGSVASGLDGRNRGRRSSGERS